ncbi:3-oxosteroid 1-dehydrogenase [Pseudomonas sp. ok272]|uniref:FAD-dependent oxidoreductase n=1 Tax=unclassified Pseudomonas TaxID=196821 RepID=UPI0008C6A3A3|nr:MULTISPECIES: FAD-dependent oxidoreductase [unclassified Pseudomonas]SEN43026.1 3-oxosteroid 1-dehydrogenase [Pseudomonas sp. ok272]SFN25339.1 3-oxosteroid 1-dehydrogenase [Pseudomonas sp. ok602]
MNAFVEDKHCAVLVVGSGAGALLAANRAHDLGLKVIVIEKSDRYGGTSALSGGGIWIPNNIGIREQDTYEEALTYFKQCTHGLVAEEKLRAYLDSAPEMVEYMRHNVGVKYNAVTGYADYCQHLPGASDNGRTMFVEPIDAGVLGDDFFALREADMGAKLFGRVALDYYDGQLLGARAKGWKRKIFSLIWNYWSDIGWRLKTRRDRRVTMGSALVAGLRIGLQQRGVTLLLNTRLERFIVQDGVVRGAVVSQDCNHYQIHASQAVIVASGGFEQSQPLRDAHLPGSTLVEWSVTPMHNNTGDALIAGEKIGADTEFMHEAWWAPTVRIPAADTPNVNMRSALFIERSYAHSLCVNRQARRFTNEAMSYNDFGHEMLKDNANTGANMPCWFIFDATYRQKNILGRIMPGSIMPDASLPPEWWDSVLYRAGSIGELARKIGVDPATLEATVSVFNGYAKTGIDLDFKRGHYSFDRFYCDPRQQPNPSLGALERAPYYAIRVDLGDLGTKGGLKVDRDANVLDIEGRPIPGLYAIGNASGAVTADAYPGAGGTLGPALTFGYRAANHIAQRMPSTASSATPPRVHA